MTLNIEERLDEILKTFAVKTHDAKPGQDETPNFTEAKQALLALIDEARAHELKMVYAAHPNIVTQSWADTRIAQLNKSETEV